MTISGFDALFYTLAFLVPGFILHATLSMFVPTRAEQTQLSLLRLLFFSSLNYAVWSWLIFIVISTGFYSAHPYLTAAAWVIVVLVSPVVLGIVLGRLSQKEALRRAFQRIGINTIHEIPTAWDYKFSKTDRAVWILVTLKDGSQVAGLYGSRSVASSESSERDLYIQEIYQITGDGPWQRIPLNNHDIVRGRAITASCAL